MRIELTAQATSRVKLAGILRDIANKLTSRDQTWLGEKTRHDVKDNQWGYTWEIVPDVND